MSGPLRSAAAPSTMGAGFGADENRGRGLVLVDALAVDRGVRDRLGPGETVRAECATAPRA
ncbi:hypothetical protein ACFPZI_20010 [Streptomyces chlorus]|uniref:Uncharacterized protein n=1 Tax=Streptomyces chlorus TaxID=887452 RepID=A0ABW1E0S8_9ACTN